MNGDATVEEWKMRGGFSPDSLIGSKLTYSTKEILGRPGGSVD